MDTKVNKLNKYGMTPLHAAPRSGYTDTAQILLDNGATHNVTDEDGRTPLSLAKERGRTDTTNMIMTHFTKQQ